MVKEENTDVKWRFTGFYGSPYAQNKTESRGRWRHLKLKFEAWWTIEETVEETIKKSWNSNSGTIVEKLGKLQVDLKEWASSIKKGKEGLKKKLTEELEVLLEKERTDDTLAKIIDTRVQLNMEIDRDEIYWEQRARANWLKVGDKNSVFFHNYALARKKMNMISRLEVRGGRLTSEESEISEEATSFFQEMFMSRRVGDLSHILSGIKECISSDINDSLVATFTAEEVFVALKEMGPTKARGPDGFPTLFFQRYWHIVGGDVVNFCLGILNDDQSFGKLNSTDIVLIPKVKNPINLANFRPISLCMILYKIVAKTVANRLQRVIGKCIDEAQSAFVPGRLISDNVLLAYEMLHTFRRKRTGTKGFMAVKVDMSKAYDRVEWDFLKEVMLKMGFGKKWVDLILKCITTTSFAVNINGKRGRTFNATRGLRQGDPLSPFLFLLCSEGLSALMRMVLKEGLLKGAKASRGGPELMHLLFADDCILFGEATREGANLLKGILKEYERCSGQCVNFDKSIIFYSSNTTEEHRGAVAAVLGMRNSTNMKQYLSLPSVVGRRKKDSFQVLKEKILFRIKGWSNRFLSQGGKEVFIKSVLQAIPTYAMTCFLLPNSFCREIEQLMSRFWWQKAHGKKGIHWCQWKDLCQSKEQGGMGFRDMAKFNMALLTKQGWRLMNNPDSLVARVFKAKYFPKENFLNSRLKINCSFTWKSIWAAKGILIDGLCWKVGSGKDISVLNDVWIPDLQMLRLSHHVNNFSDFKVAELIEANSREWKIEVIESTFPAAIAAKIVCIPLAKAAHDDLLAWRGESTGEFTVRSAYTLLQNNETDPTAYALHNVYREFYRRL
ncbi:reverse transcriptase [Gossypium australe]|uniref:Reverse transcriptase n=1 Tax=Gossypium australe TaxID=47621 RepID=A0A5B6W6C6_9ROSI|nr:reverse transcriptase [Gossypium australe]